MPIDPARGSELATWWEFYAFAGFFVSVLVALAILGRPPAGRAPVIRTVLRVPDAIERFTGIPGWAGTTLLFSIYGLVLAGFGFYEDVAWHVALGRDEALFTSPHTAIFIGLVLIGMSPVVCVAMCSLLGVDTRLRWRGVRVPWSALPLGALGVAGVTGFPVDELWHQQYGVDVTMWSPPHLIMILAASFTGLASWLVLADAGVRPTASRWGRVLHVIAAALTLQGLSSVQGEFSFGVPQWQHLYHPVLVSLAAGVALVTIRIVHGRFWALGIAGAIFAAQAGDLLGGGPIDTRAGATYVVSALAVEIVAAVVGTANRWALALGSGVAVGTIGLAGEWWWNQGAHQPWTTSLLPEALVLAIVAAVAGAVIGAGLGGVIGGDPGRARVPFTLVGAALVAVLVVLAIPSPRRVGDVTAEVRLQWRDAEHAVVNVRLDPPDAAAGARWFTVGSWQWGGRTVAHLRPLGGGTYTSDEALFLGGRAKSLVRLHRGAEMMAVPVRLPADVKYRLPEVPAVDRTERFVGEQQFLQREASTDRDWFAIVVFVIVGVLATAWVAACLVAGRGITRSR